MLNNGSIGTGGVSGSNGVAPVINLKTEYIQNFIGDGTMNNPFRVEHNIDKSFKFLYNTYKLNWKSKIGGINESFNIRRE